jgi:hypothetical protein
MELDWVKYSEIADRFQYKARYGDREDLRHNIILRLAEVASNNGHKPFTEGAMVRVASYVVMEYWHAEKRNGKVISLNTEVEDWEGNGIELIETIADDSAIDLEAWVDSRTWLLGCPKRLIQIAHKRVSGIALEPSEKMYLGRFRRKEQKPLASVTF